MYESYEISGKLAYLLGVPDAIIEKERPMAYYAAKLADNKHAVIVRCLSQLRNLCLNHREPDIDLTASALVATLRQFGVHFSAKGNTERQIIQINRLLSDRIYPCQAIFPSHLDWQAVRALFLMPNGMKVGGVRAAQKIYRANRKFYPYQVYLNWKPRPVGNLLFNDRHIMPLLSRRDTPPNNHGLFIQREVDHFIQGGKHTIIVVDCENSDPYKMRGALYRFPEKQILKILLLDGEHSNAAWRLLKNYTAIPVEYIPVKSLNKRKSLVDFVLISTVYQAFYKDKIDSFILFASDSDYWALVSHMLEARFLLMLEQERTSVKLKQTLELNGIRYCCIEDSDESKDLKFDAVVQILQGTIRGYSIDPRKLLQEALSLARTTLSPAEREEFLQKYFSDGRLNTIIEDGKICFQVG
ncbi:MAG TPA: hypothetical protein IAC31_05155 [Candidatus Faecousia intestinigallinarum]|nr:hypothetical protein [Candidatus Faecousia intestinigallinarum]